MQIYLKDRKLWVEEYFTKNLVDVTSEAEKYLFTKFINTENAVLADYFAVLNSNPHLKAIFVEKKKKEYEKVIFQEPQMQRALMSESTLSNFLNFYKDKNDNEIKALINEEKNLDFFEIEVTYEENNSQFIDFVGVKGGDRYSMSLASIDNYYFTPIKIKYYNEIIEGEERTFEETNGTMKMGKFFFKMADNLNEMIFENERENLFSC